MVAEWIEFLAVNGATLALVKLIEWKYKKTPWWNRTLQEWKEHILNPSQTEPNNKPK